MPYMPLTHYNLKTSGDIKEYYYKVDINTEETTGRCVILKYQGSDPAGSLTSKSSLNDLYRDTKTSTSTLTTDLLSFATAFLIICFLFSFGTLIIVILFFCKIKKITGGFGN